MKKAFYWIIGVGVFILLALLTLKYGNKISSNFLSSGHFPIRSPITTVEFDDYTTLKILQLGETHVIDGSSKRPTIGSWGSSSSSHASITYTDYTQSDKVSGLEFKSSEGSLIIEAQLVDIGDQPVTHDIFLDDGTIRNRTNYASKDHFLSVSQYLDNSYHGLSPEVILQLQDTTGGWITANGPVSSEEDDFHRVAFAFKGWSKDQKNLTFRAIRPGSKVKTFSISNPYFSAPSAPLPTVLQAHVHTDPDFTFTIQRIEETYIPEYGRLIQPKVKLTTRFGKLDNSWNSQTIFHHLISCKDPSGGLHHQTHFPSAQDGKVRRVRGIAFPAHATQAILSYGFTKGSTYPRPKSDAFILADVEVSADGKSIITNTLYRKNGITSISFSPIAQGYDGVETKIEVKGVWSTEAEQNAVKHALGGDMHNFHLLAFVDGINVSSGRGDSRGSGSSSSGGKTEFHFSKAWSGPFKAGQKMSFGIAPQLPPTIATFAVNLPTSRKRKSSIPVTPPSIKTPAPSP